METNYVNIDIDMEKYITDMRDKAMQLGELDDRISLLPLPIHEKGAFRHSTIALEAQNIIQYWDTELLYKWVVEQGNSTHPLTRKWLDHFQIKYISYYYNALQLEKTLTISKKVIYQKLFESNGDLDQHLLNIARILLDPRSFADHFKHFPKNDTIDKYERAQAEKCLESHPPGTWLLRRSSLNRPKEPYQQEICNKLHLGFYVLSFKGPTDKAIRHALILRRPGWGWALISNISYWNDTIIPRFYDKQCVYNVCFVDVMIRAIRENGLQFKDHIKDYVNANAYFESIGKFEKLF